MSPIREPDAKRRYQREWIARPRAAFFADRVCVDCGAKRAARVGSSRPGRRGQPPDLVVAKLAPRS
jgi:hypothetical protein